MGDLAARRLALFERHHLVERADGEEPCRRGRSGDAGGEQQRRRIGSEKITAANAQTPDQAARRREADQVAARQQPARASAKASRAPNAVIEVSSDVPPTPMPSTWPP